MVFVKPLTLFAVACLFSLGASIQDAANSDGHPIENVIEQLKDLKATAISNGQTETVLYNKFAFWCSNSIDALTSSVADEKENLEELAVVLDGKQKEEETLTEDTNNLQDQIDKISKSQIKATALRKAESTAYTKKVAALSNTISAVDGALTAMTEASDTTEPEPAKAEKKKTQVKKAAVLLGLDDTVTEEQVSQLWNFADPRKGGKDDKKAREVARAKKAKAREAARAKKEKARPDQLAEGDLSSHVDKYDFKSENVIELLKTLKRKFKDNKLAAVQEETNAVNAYEMATDARDTALNAARTSQKQKNSVLGRVEAKISETKNSISNFEDDLKVDSKALSDTDQQCATKKREWDKRSQVRGDEIAAMDAAVAILAKASGVRTKPPGNPIPPANPELSEKHSDFNFLQLESDVNPKLSAVSVIRQAAQATKSRAMQQLAMELKAHVNGPFAQMNNMIEKMIFRLMDEQKQEDEHKNWCDQELRQTKTMKNAKVDLLLDLNGEIKLEKGEVSLLNVDIKADGDMIGDIIEFVNSATQIRQTGKKENKLAVKDAEKAQTALGNAIAVLIDFYKSSGAIAKEPWEFIQTPRANGLPKNPNTWSSDTYTGDSDGGVISVLKEVMTDFSEMEAETRSQEAIDQEEYDQNMMDSKEEKARRTTERDMKTAEMKRRNAKIADLQRQVKNTNAELESTNQYLVDLRPACTKGDSSYADRKAARAMEIEALNKAQVILSNAFEEKPKKKPSKFLEMALDA